MRCEKRRAKMSDKLFSDSSFEKETKSLLKMRGEDNVDVFFYEITDSTNTRAKLYAENRDCGDCRPAIFFSHAQHAGRGTRGRSFESPSGGGVYISYLLYPKSGIADSLALTTYAAVSVCRAIKRITDKIDPKIKWVNDITVDGKKLSGILTEGRIEDGRMKYAIVGIGVNVAPAEHSPEVKSIMTSLSGCGVSVSPDEFAITLTDEFFLGISDIGSENILDEYRSLCAILGKDVNITDASGTRVERAVDIAHDFSLVTIDENGNRKSYISADVTVRQRTN